MRSLLAPLAYRCGWLGVTSALLACGTIAYIAGQWAGSMGGAVALAVALTAGVMAWLVRRLDDLRGPQWPEGGDPDVLLPEELRDTHDNAETTSDAATGRIARPHNTRALRASQPEP